MKSKIFIISGPSGVGKDTVADAVIKKLKKEGKRIPTYTTRSPRPDELKTRRYRFVNEETFKNLIRKGMILEYNFYNGHYYGTPKKETEEVLKKGENVLLAIDVNGGINIKKKYPRQTILIFLTAPLSEIKSRLRHRGQNTQEEIKARLRIAKKELQIAKKYDHLVANPEGHPEKAVARILEIIKSAG